MNPQGEIRLTLEGLATAKPEVQYVMLGSLPGCDPSYAFRPIRAERVAGIDYDAFKICNVFVGKKCQWWGGALGEPWPATDLFEKWDVPMDSVQAGLDVTISFINTSDKPQPFAVVFVGVVKR